jgi:hypothetical protein
MSIFKKRKQVLLFVCVEKEKSGLNEANTETKKYTQEKKTMPFPFSTKSKKPFPKCSLISFFSDGHAGVCV